MTHFAAVCVGTAFSPDYVENLYRGIARNFSGEWDFTVICDEVLLEFNAGGTGDVSTSWTNRVFNPKSQGFYLTESNLPTPPSWWHKLNLFRADIWPEGETVFYLDLDTIIIGSLDKLAQREGFNMLNWNGRFYPYGSGIMIFPAGRYPFLWDNFLYEGRNLYPRGDQEWTHKQLVLNDVEVNGISAKEACSYKKHQWQLGEVTADPETHDASIVCFHGKPRPHEIKKGLFGYREWRGM